MWIAHSVCCSFRCGMDWWVFSLQHTRLVKGKPNKMDCNLNGSTSVTIINTPSGALYAVRTVRGCHCQMRIRMRIQLFHHTFYQWNSFCLHFMWNNINNHRKIFQLICIKWRQKSEATKIFMLYARCFIACQFIVNYRSGFVVAVYSLHTNWKLMEN